MVNPSKYFDPTQARTREDFEQATRIALLSALRTYDPEGGSTIQTWIRMKMSQHLIKEVKKISRDMRLREGAIELNQTYDDGKEMIGYLAVDPIDGEEISVDTVQKVLIDVRAKLKYNILILQVFDLKMVWPNISRHLTHVILGVSKPTLSKYFAEIKKECLESFQKYNY